MFALGPAHGNILIRNADDGSLIEAINVNSDRVTFDGATVTVDPVNDLPADSNFYVRIDHAAIRDTSTEVVNTTLFAEDFEELALRDSELATDDILIDVDDYVVLMAGTLDVKVAGEYTFGTNSDEGQALYIDVGQNGLDLISPELDDIIIEDDTTHGTENRLSVCGFDATATGLRGQWPGCIGLGRRTVRLRLLLL